MYTWVMVMVMVDHHFLMLRRFQSIPYRVPIPELPSVSKDKGVYKLVILCKPIAD